MALDLKRQARVSAARKLAAEMGQDAATEHLPDELEAVDSPAEESMEPQESAELTPEEAQKLSGLAALLK